MQTMIIDGHAFAIAFAGFDQPLQAALEPATGDGSPGGDQGGEGGAGAALIEVTLPPWPCARHLASMRRHLRADGGALALDSQGYADDVLAWAEVPEPLRPDLRPLALWWAHGLAPDPDPADEDLPPPDADGRVRADLGAGLHAWLRPWTWGQRLAAQRAHLAAPADSEGDSDGDDPGAGDDFDPVGYLESMLAASLVHLEDARGQAIRLADIDAQATRRLLAAVAALNHPGMGDPLAGLPPRLAAATLRLCATMGWTPSRVLATPAAEVERLLALLDQVQGPVEGTAEGARRPAAPAPRPPASRPAPRRPRLADHPDAVVILFDDDPGGNA